MVYFANQWQLEFFQAEKGSFSGKWTSCHTPRIQIQRMDFSHGFWCNGTAPDQTVAFVFVKSSDETVFMNYEPVRANEYMVLHGGEGFFFFSKFGCQVYSVVFEKHFFYEHFSSYFGEPFEAHQEKIRFLVHSFLSGQVDDTLDHCIRYIQGITQGTYTSKISYSEIETKVIESILEGCDIKQNYLFQYQCTCKAYEIQEALNQSVDQAKSVGLIAEDLGISERHMHRVFKECLGITPKQYLNLRRMNLIRRELQGMKYGYGYIEEIVNRYHYYHMGHFSSEYKKLFGELPSETLRKG